MIIFKIFAIPSLVKDAREASNNPASFSSKFLIKEVRGTAITIFVITLLLLTLTFIFGYTSLIAGSYWIIKFLFWLFLIPSFFFMPFLIFSIRATTRALNSFPKEIKVKEV